MNDVDHSEVTPEVQQECFSALEAAEGRPIKVERLTCFEFYERTRNCFAVISTAESRPYGCIMITKGVIF